MSIRRSSNLLFIALVILFASTDAKTGFTVATTTNDSAQSNAIFGNCLYGKVSHLTSNIQENITFLLDTCEPATLAYLNEVVALSKLVGHVLALEKSDPSHDSILDQIDALGNYLTHTTPLRTATESTVRLTHITHLASQIISSAESNTLITGRPIHRHVAILVNNGVTLGYFENSTSHPADQCLSNEFEWFLTPTVTNLSGYISQLSSMGSFNNVNEDVPTTSLHLVNNDAIKAGVAVAFWFSHASDTLANDNNTVFELKVNDIVLISINVKRNENLQSEIVIKPSGNSDINSFVAKCPDHNFVLVSIQEDCEDINIHVVIRNLLNNAREHWTYSFAAININTFTFNTYSLDSNSITFKKYNDFPYSRQLEDNVFGKSITSTLRRALVRESHHCDLPDNCTYFHTNCLRCEDDFSLYDHECHSECPTKTFENGYICSDCHTNCAECVGSTANDCTKCDKNITSENALITALSLYVLVEPVSESTSAPYGTGSCEVNCPEGTFKKIYTANNQGVEVNVHAVCTDCESGCLKCTDETTCTKCESPLYEAGIPNYYHLHDGDCKDDCPKGTYLDESDNTCKPCTPNHCIECSSATNCTECENLFPLHNNACGSCPDDHWNNNNVCEECLEGCIECTNATECTKCEAGLRLVDKDAEESNDADHCTPNCDDGYGEVTISEVENCSKCTDSNCLQCNGDVDVCKKCNSSTYLHEGECKSECPDPTYERDSDRSCQPCDETCASCSDSESCDTCIEGLLFKENSCLTECPDYWIPIEDNCVECQESDISCLKCKNATSELCTKCKPTHWLHLDTELCIEECSDNKYPFNLTLKQCKNCSDVNCSSCPSDSCNLCKLGYHWNGTSCTDDCGSGKGVYTNGNYFTNYSATATVCKNCTVSGCEACDTNVNTCDECSGTAALYNNSCESSCPTDTFPSTVNGIRVCIDCPEDCLTCNSLEDCTSCTSTTVLNDGSCDDSCDLQDAPVDGVCEDCSENCDVCHQVSGTQTTTCDSCVSPKVLFEGSCHDNCPEKMFNNNGVCANCSTNCQDCDSATVCNICIDNHMPINNNGVVTCVTSCGERKTPVESTECKNCTGADCSKLCNEDVCENCTDSNCLVCEINNPNECEQCDQDSTHKYLQVVKNGNSTKHVCKESCDDGFLPDSNNECKPCKIGCTVCSGTADNCSECDEDYFFMIDETPTTCEPSCPDFTYQVSGENICENCTDNTNCKKCNPLNPDQCLDCKDNTYNYNGSCISDCSDGKKITTVNEEVYCEDCLTNCKVCDDSPCDECNAGLFKKIVGTTYTCVNPCGDGFIENSNTQNCDECQVDNCKVCSVLELNKCEECLGTDKVQVGGKACGSCTGPTYVSDNGKSCVPCADSNCASCDKDKCNSCNSPFKLYEGVCVEYCPEGQIGVEGVCQDCAPAGCGFCTGTNESECLMCSNDQHLETWIEQGPNGPVIRKKCDDECPEGQFSKDNVDTITFKGVSLTINNQCNKCPTNCIECTDATTCTECTEETTLHNGQCPDECPDNQVEINNQCEQCETGITDCVECDQTKLICTDCENIKKYDAAGKIIACVTECDTLGGFFLETPRDCKPCASNCDQCSNSTTCNRCSESYFLQTESPTCDTDCESGEYGSDRVCYECSVAYCDNCPSDVCESCTGNKKLKTVTEYPGVVGSPGVQVQTCVDNCGDEYFVDGNVCSECEDNCKKCDDETTCTQCNSTHYLYNADCLEECDDPLTEIHHSTNGNTCQRCHENCASCAVDDINNCSSCIDKFFLKGTSCVSDCGNGKIGIDSNLSDELGGVCTNCTVTNCLKCSPDAATCTECSGDLYLFNNMCIEECDDGSSTNNIRPRTCDSCNIQDCSDCEGNTGGCDQCAETYALLIPELGDPECLPACPVNLGFWKKENTTEDDQTYYTCERCPATCKTCKNVNNLPVCETCKDTYFLKTGACVDECGDGLYESSLTKKCEACPTQCKECPAGVCIECNTDFYLQERVEQEGTPNETSSFHCVDPCDDFFYETTNKTCARCETGCIDCQSSTDCDKCVSPYYLKSDDCVEDCGDKFYEVNSPERICSACIDPNCKTCNSSGICETCDAGFNLLVDTKTCHSPDCPNNYYLITNKCHRCSDSNCISCPNNECIHCTGTMVLLDGDCESSCGEKKVALTTPGYISKVCDDCETNCDECVEFGNGNSKCTSCISPTVLNHLNQCVTTCPSGEYPDQATGKCEDCTVPYCDSCPDDTCETCQETQEGDLLSLFTDPINGEQECDEDCPSGFTDVDGTCTPCEDEHCDKCTEPNTCNQCETDYLYFIQNAECQDSSECGQGQYEFVDSNGRKSCGNCKQTCKTCSNGTTCDSCPVGTSLLQGQCTDDCGQNKVSENSICVPCFDELCKTCSSSLEGACQDCIDPNLLRLNGSCHSSCETAQFSNNGVCANCSADCIECDSLAICDKCNSEHVLNKVFSDLTLISATCVDVCPLGKYAENGVCHKCSDSPANLENCSNCDLPEGFNRETDTQHCNTCSSGYLYLGECESPCPSDTFVSGLNCVHCGTDCISCDKANDCDECNSSSFLHDDACVKECPNRYFGNTVDRTCDDCSSNCLKCTDATNCDLCDFVNGSNGDRLPLVVINSDYTNHLQNLGHEVCISSCPNGYFLDKSGNHITCTKCSSVLSNCAECTSGNSCDSCESGSVLSGDYCESSCPAGTVAVDSICKPCHESCEYCKSNDRDYCTQCKDTTKILYEGVCRDDCPDRYYISGNSCVKCGDNCAECDASGCKVCDIHYFLYENKTCDLCKRDSGMVRITEVGIAKCVDCDVENCDYCEQGNPNVCETCEDSFRLYADSCHKPCPNKTYNLNLHECEDCPIECELCSSPDKCSKCIAGHFLIGEACESSCPNTYYENDVDRTCDSCQDPHCNKCTNGVSETCTTCKPTHPILFNDLCTDKCTGATYESNGSCLACGEGCEKCNSNGYCLDCDTNHLLQDGECVDECDSGFYQTNEGGEDFCKPCSMSNCEKCNANECHICEEGQYLKDGNCVSNCGPGFWTNQQTAECEECPETCALCTSATQCTKCTNGNFLQEDNSCDDKCPIGQVGNPITRVCDDCETNCARCTAGENSKCYQCKTPFIFQDDECVTKCASNYFHDEFNNICLPCSDNCSHCSFTSAGEKCLSCLGDYILDSGRCRNPCPASHTMVDGECVSCFDENCEDCGSNTKKCTKCSDESGLYLHKGACIDDCPDGYYEGAENGNKCLACPSDCDKCHKDGESIVCDLCENGFFKHLGICYQTCPESGTYPHCDTRTCEPCDSSCATCYDGDAENCITCADTYFLSYKNCVKNENCPVGKFGHEGNCVFCTVNNCDKCSDLQTCDVCQEGFVLEGTSTCKLASSYFSVIGRPKVLDESSNSLKTISILEDLPELATSHKTISLSFWIRLINSRISSDGFWPIISLLNESSLISFGIRRENGSDFCSVKSNSSEVKLSGCSFENLQEWNFFTVSLTLVDTLQVNIYRSTLTNTTLNVSSGSIVFSDSSVLNINSSIVFNSTANLLGAVEITKLYAHNYTVKQSKITPFQNDTPSNCDYYCSTCNASCTTCSNGDILANDWRCPAGGFNYFETGAINLGEQTVELESDVTHDFSSDLYQLNLWVLPKLETWSAEVKSQNAPVDSFNVTLNNSSIQVNGVTLNYAFVPNKWSHIAIAVSQTSISIKVHDLKENLVANKTENSNNFRRLYTYSTLKLKATSGNLWVDLVYVLINNHTDEIKPIHLQSNCTNVDETKTCISCEEGHELNAINQCILTQTGPEYVQFSPDALTVVRDNILAINDNTIMSTNSYTVSFWFRKLIASHYTETSTEYDILQVVKVNNQNETLIKAVHLLENDTYDFKTNIKSGENEYLLNLKKSVSSYSQWVRAIVTVTSLNNLTVDLIDNQVGVLHSTFTIPDGISSFILGAVQLEVNTQFAKIHIYSSSLEEVHHYNEEQPVPCDALCKTCDWDSGVCLECHSGNSGNPNADGSCPAYFVGFKSAFWQSSEGNNDYQEEQNISSFNLSPHLASSSYSVIGSFTHYNLSENELPDGDYVIFNLTDNYLGRVTEETTTEHLISFQVNYRGGNRTYSFLVNDGMSLRKVEVNLEVLYGDQLLIHASIDVSSKTFKYYVLNHRLSISDEDVVKLVSYPERLINDGSLRIFGSTNGLTVDGLFTDFYLVINSFFKDSYVTLFQTKLNPVCGSNCEICSLTTNNSNICHSCELGYNLTGVSCIHEDAHLPSGRILLQGDLLQNISLTTSANHVYSSTHLSSIRQISLFVRRNYFSNTQPVFAKIGNVELSFRTNTDVSQLQVSIGSENIHLELNNPFVFWRIRILKTPTGINVLANSSTGSSVAQSSTQNWTTIFSNTTIKLSNEDNQVQLYGVELLTSATASPSIEFRGLDCKADFTQCVDNVIIAPTGPFELGDSSNTKVSHLGPYRSTIPYIQNNDNFVLKLRDHLIETNNVRSNAFSVTFLLNFTGLPAELINVLSLRNNQVQIGQQNVNHPILEILFNNHTKSLVVRTKTAVIGSDALATQTETINFTPSTDIKYAYVDVEINSQTVSIIFKSNETIQRTITLPHGNTYVTESSWISFFESAEEPGTGSIENFYFDYNVHNLRNRNAINRPTLTNPCSYNNVGDLCIDKTKPYVAKYNHLTPGVISFLDEEDHLLKLKNETGSPYSVQGFYVKFWFQNATFQMNNYVTLTRITLAPHNKVLEILYKTQSIIVKYDGFTHLYNLASEILERWVSVDLYLNYQSSQVTISTLIRRANGSNLVSSGAQNFVIASGLSNVVVNSDDQTSVLIGDLSGANLHSFLVYNFVAGYNHNDQSFSSPPAELVRSCASGHPDQICQAPIPSSFEITDALLNQSYTYTPLSSITGIGGVNGGYLYAPAFGITYKVENLNLTTINQTYEVLFEIAGYKTLETVSNQTTQPNDMLSGHFTIAIAEGKKLIVKRQDKTIFYYTWTNVLVTPNVSFFIHAIYDNLTNRVVYYLTFKDYFLYYGPSQEELNPITHSSLVYKKPNVGSVKIDVNGIEYEPIEHKNLNTVNNWCYSTTTHATFCQLVAETNRWIYTQCEAGWTLNNGTCTKTNTLPEP